MSTNEKLISIIVPAYNVEKYIEYSVRSIVNQTYDNLEIIIVNDGSTDSTPELIEKLQKEDKRIRSITHEKNRGLYQARITGVEAASGDYIAFVDADDSISVDWFRLLLKKAVETDSDIVLANTISKDENKRMFIDNSSYFITRKKFELENEQIIDYLMEDEGMCFSLHTVWNKLYSKSLWTQSLPSLKKITQHFVMTEDIAFSVVLHYFAKRLTYSNHDGYFYYRNADSSTLTTDNLPKLKKNLSDLMCSFNFVLDFLKEKNLYDKYSKKYNNWKDRYFRWWSYKVKSAAKLNDEDYKKLQDEFLTFFDKEDFEFAREEDAFFTEATTNWNKEYEKIKCEILDENIEYVSFDIFDTLILRPFLEPSDIYTFMEDVFHEKFNTGLSFKTVRQDAEKNCRKQMQIMNPTYHDVTLEEIYEQLSKDYNISKEISNELRKKEEELEVHFCVTRKAGKELYEMAHAVGKRIVLISDMYLQMDCIEKILKKNGYNLHEEVFLSSKERKLKYNGDLFHIALTKLGVKPSSLIHIGDNWNADFVQPQKQGCKSCFIPKTKDAFFNYVNDRYTGEAIAATFNNVNSFMDNSVIMNNPTVRCLYALVANEIYDNPFVSFNPSSNYNRDAYFIGYFPVGMHLLGLCKWIGSEMINNNYNKIHFLARDGFLPKRIYDVIKEYETNLPESNYIYASRKSLIPATVRSTFDILNIKNNCSIYGQTPQSIYKVYADVLKPLDESIKQAFANKGILLEKRFQSEEEFQVFINTLIEYAYDAYKANENFDKCGDYFRSEINENDVTFDLGYSGKLQSAICSALGFPVDTLFLHSNGFESRKQAIQNNYKISTYYNYATPMSGIVNEFIFSDYAPSCIGYTKKESKVVPVFEEKEIAFQEKYLLDEIAFACENFVRDFYETFAGYLDMFEFQPIETSLAYERFLTNPKWFDINLLQFCYLEDEYYGGISKKKMSDHWWWQMNHRCILMPESTVSYVTNVPEGMETLYNDGLFVSFYKKINAKYPMGSKKRERLKKFVKKFVK